ncbi:oligosaccharyl transferase, archaeosortase A system-associated [Halobacteriales archaeon QS_4_69_34]|nr:MAG: oligosaccharyl transferase, archaeosortase A system-associated [Halobacteriales archaeon QS_4_69_34]
MGQRSERARERVLELGADLGSIESFYHVPVLLAVMAFMLWLRVRDWQRFVRDGQVVFSGNDAWYHIRETSYVVRNWPSTMPFDPWTSFPTGTSVGQFGTLYDQLVATAALIVGLGSPTEHTVALTLLFAPAVLGTLVAVPTYLIGRRLGGRFGGLVGVVVLALSPSTFLGRSVVGFSDHHVAEAFFQVLAVAAMLAALAVAAREKPVYEQFAERDLDGLRPSLLWAALAGVAIALYILVWPPGVLLIGVLGTFFVVALPVEYLLGRTPEPTAIAGAVALSVATAVLLLVAALGFYQFEPFELGTTTYSLLQPGLALAVTAGCLFLAWFARQWDTRGRSRIGYPAAVGGLLAAGTLLAAVALPDLYAFVAGQLERVVGFGSTATSLTVGEAQPPFNTGDPFGAQVNQALGFLNRSYGLAFYTAAVGAALMLGRIALGRAGENRTGYLLVVVWALFMTAAALTQARFNYYLIVPVAVLNAFLVGQVLRALASAEANGETNPWDVEAYQLLVVFAVVLVIAVPLVVGSPTAPAYADARSNPGNGIVGWQGALDWLDEETPDVGTYAGGDEMAFYGSYDPPADGDFDYPNGAYGVLSWWDYGHWITQLGHRIPVANPFQQNAHQAANYLLATNESVANRRLADESEGVRYTMIDWKMADPGPRTKFFAPVVWYDANNRSFTDSQFRAALLSGQGRQAQFQAYVPNQRYYETMLSRLYNFHGSAAEVQPVVLDYERPRFNDDGSLAAASIPTGGNASPVRQFDNLSAARAFAAEEGTARVGGIGRVPQERVPALEHYRLVHATERTTRSRSLPAASQNWVKTFERVPGATVEGTGPPNSNVTASVTMRMPNGRDTFTYEQRARTDGEGRFTMGLPYSTTGYDNWSVEEGYTNVSVRAVGPYEFRTNPEVENGTATFDNVTLSVPEANVVGEAEGPLTAELTEQSVDVPTNATGNATNATGNATDATGNTSASTSETNATNGTGNASNGTGSGPGGENGTNASTADENASAANASALAAPAVRTGAAAAERRSIGPARAVGPPARTAR